MERKDNADNRPAPIMHQKPNWKRQVKALLALTAECLLFSLPVMAREDEMAAFDNFHRLVQASDP
jgi:hypothetical protein